MTAADAGSGRPLPKSGSTLPLDWRLMSSVRMTSPKPLLPATTPSSSAVLMDARRRFAEPPLAADRIAVTCQDAADGFTDPQVLLQQQLLHWKFPEFELPQGLPALAMAAFMRTRIPQWISCLRDAHQALVAGRLPYFYVVVRAVLCVATCGAFGCVCRGLTAPLNVVGFGSSPPTWPCSA